MRPVNESINSQTIPNSIDREKNPICMIYWFFIFFFGALAMCSTALMILVTEKKDGFMNAVSPLSFDPSCSTYIKNKYSINGYTLKTKISTIALLIVCGLGLIEITLLLIKGRKAICFCEYENKYKYRKWLRPMEKVLNVTGIVDTLPTTRQPLINKAENGQTKPQQSKEQKKKQDQKVRPFQKKQAYEQNYPFSGLFFVLLFLQMLILMVPFSTHFSQLIEWKVCNSFDITQKKLSLILGMEGGSLLVGLVVFILALRYKRYLEEGDTKQQEKPQPVPEHEKKSEQVPKQEMKKEESQKQVVPQTVLPEKVQKQQIVQKEIIPEEVIAEEVIPSEEDVPQVATPQIKAQEEKQQQKMPQSKLEQKVPIKVQQKPQPKKQQKQKPVAKQKQKPKPKVAEKVSEKQVPPVVKEEPKPVKVQEPIITKQQFEKSNINFNINVKVDMPQMNKPPKQKYQYKEDSSSEEYTPRRKSNKKQKNRMTEKSRLSRSRVSDSDEIQIPVVVKKPSMKAISTQTVVDQEMQTDIVAQNTLDKSQAVLSERIPERSSVSKGMSTVDIEDSLSKAIQTEKAPFFGQNQISSVHLPRSKDKGPVQIQMVSLRKDFKSQDATKSTFEASSMTESVLFQLSFTMTPSNANLTMTPSNANLTMTPSFSNLIPDSILPNPQKSPSRKELCIQNHEKIEEFDKLNKKQSPLSPINKNTVDILMETNSFFVRQDEEAPVSSRVLEDKLIKQNQKSKKTLQLSQQVVESQEKPSPKRSSIRTFSSHHQNQIKIQPFIQSKPALGPVSLPFSQAQIKQSSRSKLKFCNSVFTIQQSSPFASFNSNVIASKSQRKPEKIVSQQEIKVEKRLQTQNKTARQLQIHQLPGLVLQTIQKTFPIKEERFLPTENKVRLQQEYPIQQKDKTLEMERKIANQISLKSQQIRIQEEIIAIEVQECIDLQNQSIQVDLKHIQNTKVEQSVQYSPKNTISGSEIYSQIRKEINNSQDRILTNQIYIESDSNQPFLKKSVPVNLKYQNAQRTVQKLKSFKKNTKPKINALAEQAELDAKIKEEGRKHFQGLNYDTVLKHIPNSHKNKIAFLSDSSSASQEKSPKKSPRRQLFNYQSIQKEIPLIRRLLSIAEIQAQNPTQPSHKARKLLVKGFNKNNPSIDFGPMIDDGNYSSVKETATSKVQRSSNFSRNRRFQKISSDEDPVHYNQFCEREKRRRSSTKKKQTPLKNQRSMNSFSFAQKY